LLRSPPRDEARAKLRKEFMASRDSWRQAAEVWTTFAAQEAGLATTGRELVATQAEVAAAEKDIASCDLAGRNPAEAEGRLASARSRLQDLQSRAARQQQRLAESQPSARTGKDVADRLKKLELIEQLRARLTAVVTRHLARPGNAEDYDDLHDIVSALNLLSDRQEQWSRELLPVPGGNMGGLVAPFK
jgi:hypothetical protein